MHTTLLAVSEIGDALDIIKQYGPFAGFLILVTIFFIWRDWKREASLTKRVQHLEDYTRETLIPLVTNVAAVVSKNTTVMERLEKYLEK